MKLGQFFAIALLFFTAMYCHQLQAVHNLTRTYTIKPDSLHQIRAAAGRVTGEPSDGLITQYWEICLIRKSG